MKRRADRGSRSGQGFVFDYIDSSSARAGFAAEEIRDFTRRAGLGCEIDSGTTHR